MQITITERIEAKSWVQFKARHPEARVIEIDGAVVLGVCEVCGYPILEGDPHTAYSDGVLTCARCEQPDLATNGLHV